MSNFDIIKLHYVSRRSLFRTDKQMLVLIQLFLKGSNSRQYSMNKQLLLHCKINMFNISKNSDDSFKY